MKTIKEKVLQKIARAFNGEGIVWGIGASLLLFSHNITDHYNDIDIVITKANIAAADRLLSAMGKKSEPAPTHVYATETFYEYDIDGVDVDVMCNFEIRSMDIIYRYDFNVNALAKEENLDGEAVYFTALEDWYVLYQLMPEREGKVKMIESFFVEHPRMLSVERIEKILEKQLPEPVRRRTKQLVNLVNAQ